MYRIRRLPSGFEGVRESLAAFKDGSMKSDKLVVFLQNAKIP